MRIKEKIWEENPYEREANRVAEEYVEKCYKKLDLKMEILVDVNQYNRPVFSEDEIMFEIMNNNIELYNDGNGFKWGISLIRKSDKVQMGKLSIKS